MTHSEMNELYELFVLRTLEPEQASEIDRHLREGCAHCESKIAEAEKLMAAFGANVGIIEPPADLKRRVLTSIRSCPTPGNASAGKRASLMPTLYALAGLCAALIAVCIWLGTQRTALQSR